MECPRWKKANNAPVFVLVPDGDCCDFSTSVAPTHQAAQEMVLFVFGIPLMSPVNVVLSSARSRSYRDMHVWLVNHSPALASCSLFIGWLSSVFYTSQCGFCDILTETSSDPQAIHRVTLKSSLKCNVCYLMCILCGSPEGVKKLFIFIFLFIYFSYLEIGPWLREFRAKNAVDFSQLTFDPGQKELVVGAR